MTDERPETKAVWRQLREAWIETEHHKRRLHKMIEFMRAVEWSNRRMTGENARELVAFAMRGYHGTFFRDQETNEWTWKDIYAWIDSLETRALEESLNAAEKEIRAQRRRDDGGMAQADNDLRESYLHWGYVISCFEQITRHPSYSVTRCVIVAQRRKNEGEGMDTIEIARSDTWDEAVDKATKWLDKKHSLLDSRQRPPPEGPPASFDTDLQKRPDQLVEHKDETSPESSDA